MTESFRGTKEGSKISRREFLKLTGLAGVAVLLAACGVQNTPSEEPIVNQNSSGERQGHDPIAELDKYLDSFGPVEIGNQEKVVNGISILSDKVSELVKKNQVEIATAVVASSLEPTPIGETVLLVIAGGTILALSGEALIELNKHSIERRGPELAQYIKDVVETAFLGPSNDLNKKIICLAGMGVVEGCDALIHLAVEVSSRTTPGKMRVASILFGRRVDGKWVQVTALYKDGPLDDKYVENTLESLKRKGIEASFAACTNFPPPDILLGAN